MLASSGIEMLHRPESEPNKDETVRTGTRDSLSPDGAGGISRVSLLSLILVLRLTVHVQRILVVCPS
jgi:hypothetical protein